MKFSGTISSQFTGRSVFFSSLEMFLAQADAGAQYGKMLKIRMRHGSFRLIGGPAGRRKYQQNLKGSLSVAPVAHSAECRFKALAGFRCRRWRSRLCLLALFLPLQPRRCHHWFLQPLLAFAGNSGRLAQAMLRDAELVEE